MGSMSCNQQMLSPSVRPTHVWIPSCWVRRTLDPDIGVAGEQSNHHTSPLESLTYSRRDFEVELRVLADVAPLSN